MNNTNDYDLYDFDDDIIMDDLEYGQSFSEFKGEHPSYLDKLNNQIKLLYNTYMLVHNRRFLKIKKHPECIEIARRCGFGMLMRHAMETIVTSLATENGVEVSGRSVFERLGVLKGQSIQGYDRKKLSILYDLLDLTNEIAHPHVLTSKVTDYNQLVNFYGCSSKELLEYHISYIEAIMEEARIGDFGITKEISKSRKQGYKYLLKIRELLENFNIFNKTTSILIQGCLVRQLTECSANLWAYNNDIIPTDFSTFENQISLGKVLHSLSQVSKAGKSSAFGTSALTPHVVHNLYDLKAASNSLMHVDKFATNNLSKQGKILSDLYKVVKSECSPHVMKKKLSESESLNKAPRKRIREKSPVLTTLLCGLFGWFGFHHFYTGRIVKGIIYIPFLGFIVGPFLDLRKLLSGRFRDSNGLRIRMNSASRFIATLLILGHLGLFFIIGTKLYDPSIIEKIKNFNPMETFTVEKCDNAVIEEMNKIDISDHSATSYLSTSKAKYEPNLATDGISSTCWQEGVEGVGEGESLTFTFENEESISAISLLLGKHKSEKAYFDNARPSKLIIKIGNMQYFIEAEDIMQRQTFRFSSPKAAKEVTIVIDSAYPGNVWEDLCISEIEFYKEELPEGEING